MGALDPVKILMVLVIALIVLGPERLPKVARQLGAAWHALIQFRDKVEQEVREAIPNVDLPHIPARPGVAVANFIADLASGKPLPTSENGTNGAAPAADATTPAAGAPDAATPDGDEAPSPVPALAGPVPALPSGPPLALDRPLVPPDDPSMN